MRIVVTGGNGFVGRAVCRRLLAGGHEVVVLTRKKVVSDVPGGRQVTFDGGLNNALAGADALVHLAAKAHVLNEKNADAAAIKLDVDLTVELAKVAIQTRLKRFIFVSSIKVNGEQTHGQPFTADMLPAPVDRYGYSKAEAEGMLRSIAGAHLDVVILRPPLMYGPELKGNFARLFAFADRGLPLPLASVRNARDILSVDNFADLVSLVLGHPAAPGRIFLARDGKAISTPELYRAISRSLGRPARLFPVPISILSLAAKMAGRSGDVQRLIGDLEIDDTDTREILSWSPPTHMDETLRKTAEWWKSLSKTT